MKRTPLVLLLVLSLLLQGCATFIHGSRQEVALNSCPSDATATVDGINVRTPATVSLSRTKDYVVNVEKEGYEPGQAVLNRKFNGWSTILGNIVWLVPGLIVDFLTGGAWTLEPKAVNVQLATKGSCPVLPGAAVPPATQPQMTQ